MNTDTILIWQVDLWNNKFFKKNAKKFGPDDYDTIGIYENFDEAMNLYYNAPEVSQKRISILKVLYNKQSDDREILGLFFPFLTNNEEGD